MTIEEEKEYTTFVKNRTLEKIHTCWPLLIVICLAVTGPSLAKNAIAENATSGLRLIGTIEGSSLGGAVLQDASGKQFFYLLFDRLPDGSQIVILRNDSISLKAEDGTVFDMFISHQKSVVAAGAPGISAAPVSNPLPQPGPTASKRHFRHNTDEDE